MCTDVMQYFFMLFKKNYISRKSKLIIFARIGLVYTRMIRLKSRPLANSTKEMGGIKLDQHFLGIESISISSFES